VGFAQTGQPNLEPHRAALYQATGIDDPGWMFTRPDGQPVHRHSLNQAFHRIARRAGVPDLTRIRFHDLRHTHASLLIMDSVPVKVVSERLGHANVAFTMHTHQLLPGMSAAASRQFAALLAAHHR
jgi:integrase